MPIFLPLFFSPLRPHPCPLTLGVIPSLLLLSSILCLSFYLCIALTFTDQIYQLYKKPYNPVVGESHYCFTESGGKTTRYLGEQVFPFLCLHHNLISRFARLHTIPPWVPFTWTNKTREWVCRELFALVLSFISSSHLHSSLPTSPCILSLTLHKREQCNSGYERIVASAPRQTRRGVRVW